MSKSGDMFGVRVLTHHRGAMCYALTILRFSLVAPSNVGTYLEAVLGTIQTKSWCFTVWVGD